MKASEFLDLLMKRAGDNPNSLSRKSKVPQSTIFRFIEGVAKEPRLSTLEKIARVYGIPVETFLSEKARNSALSDIYGPKVEPPPQETHSIHPEWPFKSIDPERYFAASEAVRTAIEDSVERQLSAFELDLGAVAPKKSA